MRRSTDKGKARCLCECGTEVFVAPLSLKSSGTRSCGCLRRDVLSKHGGFSKHPLYKIWRAMIDRCTNPKADSYPNYGGRGITVCERWMDPWLFAEDIEREIGPRPEGATSPASTVLIRSEKTTTRLRPWQRRWSYSERAGAEPAEGAEDHAQSAMLPLRHGTPSQPRWKRLRRQIAVLEGRLLSVSGYGVLERDRARPETAAAADIRGVAHCGEAIGEVQEGL